MAKKASIQRNLKRQRLVEKYAAQRAELKAILINPETSDEEFFAAQRKLAKLPSNSPPVRLRNRCNLTGRPRAYIRRFGLSRSTFRELALAGRIPGVTKSSWQPVRWNCAYHPTTTTYLSMTDPITDFLTPIRTASRAGLPECTAQPSKL